MVTYIEDFRKDVAQKKQLKKEYDAHIMDNAWKIRMEMVRREINTRLWQKHLQYLGNPTQ